MMGCKRHRERSFNFLVSAEQYIQGRVLIMRYLEGFMCMEPIGLLIDFLIVSCEVLTS